MDPSAASASHAGGGAFPAPAAAASAPPQPARSSLLSTYWRDPEFLSYVPLSTHTAMEYFSRSNFFDPGSTNEMLRMQNVGSVPPAGMPPGLNIQGWGKTPRQQEEELARFRGIEFVLVHAKEPRVEAAAAAAGSADTAAAAADRHVQFSAQQQAEDTLYVIQKRRRDGPTQTQVLETYYILNGNIHMAPDLDTILNNRLLTSLHSLRQALTLARTAKERPIDYSSLKAGAGSSAKDGKDERKSKGSAPASQAAKGGTATGTLGAAGISLSLKRDGHEAAVGDGDEDGLGKKTRLDAGLPLDVEGGFDDEGGMGLGE